MADSELTPVLIAQAWQITLLIVAVAAINRWAGKSRPHLAHALWLVVLVKCVTPPVWSSPSGVFCWLQPSRESDQPTFTVEGPSRSWSDLLVAARSTEPSDVIEQADHDWLGSDAVADESLLSVGDEWIEKMPSPSITSEIEWPNVLFGLWVLMSLGVIGVAVVRCLRCWRMVRIAPQRDCAELSAQLDTLAKQLRLRRRVRLIVTESRIGPAVIGLFRTTVLLPALIVDRLTQRRPVAESRPVAPRQESRTSLDPHRLEALEDHSRDGHPVAERQGYGSLAPILAHELLHIRRGDLWLGLLQTLAQAVWWCHPLVWWVNRRTTREAERCCDEEVLAELGCDPAAYARALVDVLELKRELKPVPVFPGVRPVEVTSQRLERIMQLGQGCQRRTPWWCWLLAGLAAAATWPGAAFVVTAEDATTATKTDPDKRASAFDETIDLDREPKLGLAYRVRVISGAEDDLRPLAQKFNEKLLEKLGAPIVVEHDELLRLLKDAQAFPRLNLISHPVATGRGRKSVTFADTATFAIPVGVTAVDGTTTLLEQSQEYGWRLTMQPQSVGIESLRLHVDNCVSRLNHAASAKVRFPNGEEKLIPGQDLHHINTTVEFKNGQHVVFPITKVPNADSQDVMLVTMQASLVFLEETSQPPEPTPIKEPVPSVLRAVGVNSDAGVTGEIVLEQVGVAPARLPVPIPVAPPAKGTERQILLSFHIYEVDEDGLKELGIKSSRVKSRKGVSTPPSVTQFQVDQDVVAKLSAMVREKRIKVLCEPSIMTRNGRAASLLSGGEFPVPAVVGIDGTKETETTYRAFGLQLAATSTIVGSDTLRVSFTMSDSKVADAPTSGGTTVAPTLISQSIQSELLMKTKQPVFLGPLGEPGAKGQQRIATLLAEIVEAEQNLPVSREKAQPAPALFSVHFDDVPLKEAMKQLAQSTGRNIVLDKAGLEDESITERTPVTIELNDVKLSSALKLILDPLNLGYRVEESGVIVVTSQQRLKGLPVIATYSVADLAIPVPKRAWMKLMPGGGLATETRHPNGKTYEPTKETQQHFRELIDLITSTCEPNSWETVGGNGQIKANDSTLSFVVRQTQNVHDEIRDVLEQLRRLQDLQAALHVETLTVPADFWQQVGKDFDAVEAAGPPSPQPQDKSALKNIARLTKKEAALLRSLVRPESAPKVTLFNGQELEVFFGGESPTMRLALKPVVSADRKVVRLQAAATKPDAELDFTKLAAITLESGHSLLLDVTEVYSVGPNSGVPILSKVPGQDRLFKNAGNAKHRTLLLVTGTVVIVEEEQELLGIPK